MEDVNYPSLPQGDPQNYSSDAPTLESHKPGVCIEDWTNSAYLVSLGKLNCMWFSILVYEDGTNLFSVEVVK